MAVITTDAGRSSAADRLDDLRNQRPDLAEAIGFYRRALPMLHVAGTAVVPFNLDVEAARRKLKVGLPVLAGEGLPFDPPTLLALFVMLCRAVQAAAPGRSEAADPGGQPSGAAAPVPGGLADAADRTRIAVEEGGLDLRPLLDAVARGDGGRVREVAARFGLDAGLLAMLVQNTLKPTLRAWAAALAADLDLSGWGQGNCPVCGSPPVLAEIRGLAAALFLRCGLCSSAWPYPARQCTFCGNHESEQLRHFTLPDAAGASYVQGCDKCRGYLKAILTQGPLPPDFVVTEDLATLDLDVLASKQGYYRATLRSLTQ